MPKQITNFGNIQSKQRKRNAGLNIENRINGRTQPKIFESVNSNVRLRKGSPLTQICAQENEKYERWRRSFVANQRNIILQCK